MIKIQTRPENWYRVAISVPPELAGYPIPTWHLGSPCFEVDGKVMVLWGMDVSARFDGEKHLPRNFTNSRLVNVVMPEIPVQRPHMLEDRMLIGSMVLTLAFLQPEEVTADDHEFWQERRDYFAREDFQFARKGLTMGYSQWLSGVRW